MTLDQIDQMITEVTARLKTLKKLRRLKVKEQDLSREVGASAIAATAPR